MSVFFNWENWSGIFIFNQRRRTSQFEQLHWQQWLSIGNMMDWLQVLCSTSKDWYQRVHKSQMSSIMDLVILKIWVQMWTPQTRLERWSNFCGDGLFSELDAIPMFWTHVPTLLTDAIIWIWQLLTRFFNVMFFSRFLVCFHGFSLYFHGFSFVFVFLTKIVDDGKLRSCNFFLLNHQDWCFWDRAMFFEVRWPSYAIICNVCYVSLKSAWYVYT